MPSSAQISESQLVPAALAVLDEQGLEGLSMRVLAERLGVRAASLYGHVRNKEDLLARVSDAICTAALAGAPDLSWRETLRWVAERLRSELRRHPGTAAVAASQQVTPEVAARFAPLVGRLAEQMRCTMTDASFAVQSIYLFTAAHALAEHGNPPSEPSKPRSYYDKWFRYALDALVNGLGQIHLDAVGDLTSPARDAIEGAMT